MTEVVFFVVLMLIFVTCMRIAADFKSIRRQKIKPQKITDPDRFRCTTGLMQELTENGTVDVFVIKICGRVVAPTDMYDTDIQVLIADVTEGTEKAKPVLSTVQQWQMERTPVFCLTKHNGKIPNRISVLSNWIQVATIPAELLTFPRSGCRKLEFVTSIVSSQDCAELVRADCLVEYQNNRPGYIDAKENSELARKCAIRLAAALCTEVNGFNHASIPLVKKWITGRPNGYDAAIDSTQRRNLEQIFEQEISSTGRMLAEPDFAATAQKLHDTSVPVERYDFMEFFLQLVRQCGLSDKRLALLSSLADILELDRDKFRAMVIKVLPLRIDQDSDMELLLGITPDMTAAVAVERLSEEYRKWNARVTHTDAVIQTQADKMINLIAEARNKYTAHS